MAGLTVQVWERNGLNLLYVNDVSSGRTLGYLDRNNGLLHLADPKDPDLRWVVVGALARRVRRDLAALPVFKPWPKAVSGVADATASDVEQACAGVAGGGGGV
ncbi:hypothetical protein KGQ19_46720 [Catenulispora sp. NL8]|uniref:Uncharacterized protein n=1 Tax=Catenulispora pinistramenti TaxID=2705254 RepID=A0ABS5L7P8_9ACTN|nr:hypothetical protein [Catenulispora pinistramenti]MBS2554375.1 hypothetical protein [Catenulispora pinistramenti]